MVPGGARRRARGSRAGPVLVPRGRRRSQRGSKPPNGWAASFGGSAWERVDDGQWYLHLFDVSQPDWNWDHAQVLEEFDSILRFWFDRGIDGFRIDVADSMSKDDTLPDVHDPRVPGQPANKYPGHPHWDRDEVHDIHRRWRRIADEYADRPGGTRTFVAEAWVTPPERLARYLRPDELHCAFNFDALKAPWDAEQRASRDRRLHRGDLGRRRVGDLGAQQPRHDPPSHSVRPGPTAGRRIRRLRRPPT